MSSAAALLTVLGVAQRFDPRTSLFGHFEPGFDYDFSDTTTLFQDTTGTTPVTGVEQTVALILDKSRGLVLGPELVTNGGPFTATTGWAGENATLSVVSGKLRVTSSAAGFASAYQTLSGLVANGWYVVAATVERISGSGTAYVRFYDTAPTTTPIAGPFFSSTTAAASGAAYFQASADGQITLNLAIASAAAANETADFNLVSVRAVPGLHQIQSTAASRAVLRSRYNQILYSEDFSNAVWLADFSGTGVSATKTPNFGIAPDGTQTATRIQLNKGAGTAGTDFARVYQSTAVDATTIRRIWIRTNDASTKTFRLSADGANFTVTGTWTQIADTGSNASLTILLQATTSTDADFLVWRPEAVRATDANIPYQRVTTATDYATGPQWPTYLEYDGVDDSYASAANLDLTSTDKLTVFAAVTRLSTAEGMLMETSADAGLNNGSFFVYGLPASGDYGFARKGTSSAIRTDTSGLSAPATSVLTYGVDLAAAIEVTAQRVNGAASGAVGSADTGSGNFVSYPLFLGRRNNTNLPFRGRMYRVIGRGAATPVATISQCERFLARQTGITL